LYRQAALLLIENNQLLEAKELLAEGTRTITNDPELLLLEALTSELSGSHASSDAVFKQLENRWPEWYKVWIANALVLESRQQPKEAQIMRQAALALGAPSSVVHLGESSLPLVSALPLLFDQAKFR
jgi:hypothetical protein